MKTSTLRTLGAALAISAIFMVGCSRTPSNVHVLSTTDCGATWIKLNVGSTVPKHTGDACGYTTALPNWPMAGEAHFKTQFNKGVLSTARISYSYSISNPLAFINEARYLGKMGGSLEISADTVGSKYEMAENVIIDKLLREVTTDLTRTLEIVNANPAQIEDAIYERSKTVLEKKGVTLADLALVIENDEQTRLAIDAATAMRVYEAAGIGEVGRLAIVARAGATSIQVDRQHDKKD